MRALVIKEFRELMRDRRTLAMLIVMPIFLLVIFGYAANFTITKVSVTVIGPDAQATSQNLRQYTAVKDNISIVQVESTGNVGKLDAERILRDRQSDAVIIAKTPNSGNTALTQHIAIYVDGTQLFTAQAANRAFLQLLTEDTQQRVSELQTRLAQSAQSSIQMQQQLTTYAKQLQQFEAQITANLASGKPLPQIPTAPQLPQSGSASSSSDAKPGELDIPTMPSSDDIHVLFNPDLKTSWVMVPGLIGLILTLIGTVITSIGLVRERENGTLEQLAVMPLRPFSIILGKVTPYFVLAVIDMVLITILGVSLFRVPFVGSIGLFALASCLFLIVVLGFGVMISSLSQTTGQAIQMALMIALPQILLSGLIFPISAMAAGIRWMSYILPLTWFTIVSQGVMLRGAGISSLWLPLVVLAFEAIVIFGIATLRMRALLTHGGAR